MLLRAVIGNWSSVCAGRRVLSSQSIDAYSESVRTALSKGMQHALAGRAMDACAAFELAANADPACHEAHANLGRLKNMMKKHNEALRHCDDALSVQPRSVEALSNKGIALAELRPPQLLEAMAAFQQALSVDPEHWQSHDCLAGVTLQLELGRRAGEYEVSDAESMLAKGLEHAEAAHRLAGRGGTMRPPESVVTKRRALRIVCDQPAVRNWSELDALLGSSRGDGVGVDARAGRGGGGAAGGSGMTPTASEAQGASTVAQGEGDAPSLTRVSMLMGAQRFDEAEAMLRCLLELAGGGGAGAGEDALVCWELACLLHFRRSEYDSEIRDLFGRAAKAWSVLEASASSPAEGEAERHADALANHASAVLAVDKDAEAARDLWKRALEVYPTHANAAISLAALLVQKDQDACGAEALLCRALDAEPDNVFALTNYAILLDRQMDQPDRADEMYRRALQACPDEPSVLHNYQAFLERRHREANE